ncbi:MAG: prepilin-type N-terminal cleavage/methylation domain-containing protein [Deltaproteobacteria bacterium]|nr:prepilin-type N-terminal cleavage/methylation domain-containing protein [Deltaproteobacteria bacterium]
MDIKENGFTLIELLIAMGMGLVIMLAIYASTNISQRSSAAVGRKVATQQDARAVLDLMAMEIRMVSFSPTDSSSIWNTIPTCSGAVSNPPCTYCKGIQKADADKIHISMDLGGTVVSGANVPSGTIGDAENEHILYYYKSDDNSIRRKVGCSATDEAILGGSEMETLVKNNAENVRLFTYYDRLGNNLADGITGNVPVASIPKIRRIRITIVADGKNPDILIGKTRKRLIYSTDVMVKNHVFTP